MGSQTDFFESTGPTSAGFRTNGTRIARGVDVTGTELGVRGSGSGSGSVGVEGHGGPNGIGVVGLSVAATWTIDPTGSKTAGVFGIGDERSAVGVRGESFGPNSGVVGVSNSVSGVNAPGVFGQSVDGIGVSAQGSTGLYASGTDGPGLQADSIESQGGVFTSQKRAQIRLVPVSGGPADPGQFPQSDVGDLAVTFTDAPSFPGLWFCVVGGGPGQSRWKQIA
jgi:hypothetical protein